MRLKRLPTRRGTCHSITNTAQLTPSERRRSPCSPPVPSTPRPHANWGTLTLSDVQPGPCPPLRLLRATAFATSIGVGFKRV